MESILVKTKSWEAERQKIFLYDEVTQVYAFVNLTTGNSEIDRITHLWFLQVPLVAMLQEYKKLRQEKEVEKQRLRVSLS